MKALGVVALTQDHPEASLQRGQVGTIVETLATDVYEVEFADLDGRTYAMLALPAQHYVPFGEKCCRRSSTKAVR